MQTKVQSTNRSRSTGVVEVLRVASKRVLVADEDPAFLRRLAEVIDRNGFGSTFSLIRISMETRSLFGASKPKRHAEVRYPGVCESC